MQTDAKPECQRETDRLEVEHFDLETQQRIEEAIRMEAVLESLEYAIEYTPEFFGEVIML